MTIFYGFTRPGDYSSGTTFASLGWTEYPARNASDVELAAPEFRTSGNSIISTPRSGQVVPPRLVYRLGSPIVRGEARIRFGQSICVLFSDDGRKMLRVERGFYNQTAHALIFHYWDGNTNDIDAFNMHVIFAPGETNGDTLASEVDFAWVVNGTNLEVYVQGKRCRIRNYVANTYVDSIPLPAPLHGSTGCGYVSIFSSDFAYSLVLRDNSDLIYCTDVVAERANDTQNRLKISGVCSIAGASTVQVDLVDDEGTSLFHGFGAVSGGVWTATTGPMAKAAEPCSFVANIDDGSLYFEVTEVNSGTILEGHVITGPGFNPGARIASQLFGPPGGAGYYQSTVAASVPSGSSGYTRQFKGFSELKISVVNVGGAPQGREVFYPLPRCLVKQPVGIGNNNSIVDYYAGYWPFVDLAKVVEWRTSGNYVMNPRADPAYWNEDSGLGDRLPSSLFDLAPNGSPRKFPDNPAIDCRAQLPWYAEPGDYVMDMTQAPNLQWSFFGTAGCVTTDMNYYGPLLHRVTIATTADWIPAEGGSGWGILLHRDGTKPNQGMPTAAWLFSMRKVGAPAGQEWSEGFLGWMRESGITHYRWMSGQAVERPNLPRDIIAADCRAMPADQSWLSYGLTRPEIPIELIVDLHNQLMIDLWLNAPGPADEGYNRFVAGYIRDHLHPSLKFFQPLSNEVWNYGQSQLFAYYKLGLARGLGKGRQATVDIIGGETVINIRSATYGRVEVGQRIIGPGIPDGATIVAFGTGTGRTGTYQMSVAAEYNATVDAYYDAAIVGGDDDYDYDGIRDWTDGITVTAGELVRSFGIYRALNSFTSWLNPNTTRDWANFELVQDGDLAAWRAHAEATYALADVLRDEFGGDFGDRCQLIVERWADTSQFGRSLAPYLDWIPALRSDIRAVCVANYFGHSPNQLFNWAYASPAVRTATATLTGAARIAVWRAAALADVAQAINRHKLVAATLIDMTEVRGLPEGTIPLWTYEGGSEYAWEFSNAALATTGAGPIDQTVLRDDIFTFMEAHHYEIMRTFYEGMINVCGGRLTHFDSFTPTRNSNFFPVGFTGGIFWGLSRHAFDRAATSSKYKALRDISIDYGGGDVPDPPSSTRRRQQALILS